jgi:glycerol-3-phosphate acyltransferase PlsY
VDVDTKIVELVQLLNAIPGVETLNSCQGHLGPGYVQFQGSKAVAFVQAMAAQMVATFAKQGVTFTVGKQKYAHSFSIEIDETFCMRWGTRTYPLVLDAVRCPQRGQV